MCWNEWEGNGPGQGRGVPLACGVRLQGCRGTDPCSWVSSCQQSECSCGRCTQVEELCCRVRKSSPEKRRVFFTWSSLGLVWMENPWDQVALHAAVESGLEFLEIKFHYERNQNIPHHGQGLTSIQHATHPPGPLPGLTRVCLKSQSWQVPAITSFWNKVSPPAGHRFGM